jgi:tetratricopeptide (TPR) repeat protein
LLYELNFDLAEREFQRALELNPNYPQARAWYGLFFLQWVAGRISEGHDQLAYLLQIDPLSAYAHAIVSISFLSSDRIPEAVEHGRRAVELDPNSYLAHYGLAVSLCQNRQYENAIAAAERALTLSGRHNWALTALVTIYAACGKHDSARAVYSELQSRRAREDIQPALLATAADAVGEVNEALEIAQQALVEKDPMFVMLPRGWPDYSRLHTEPRFREIVSHLGLPDWTVTA